MPRPCARFCNSRIVFCHSAVKSLSATFSNGTGWKYSFTALMSLRTRTTSDFAKVLFVWFGKGFFAYNASSWLLAACRFSSRVEFSARLFMKKMIDQPSNPSAMPPKIHKNKLRLTQSMSESDWSFQSHVDLEPKCFRIFRHVSGQRHPVRVKILHLHQSSAHGVRRVLVCRCRGLLHISTLATG